MADGTARHLEVVSYNIHKGLGVGNLRVALNRMRDALREQGADLVLIQEVVGSHEGYARRFPDWPAAAQFEYLADSMWPHYAYGRNAVYSGRHHGNAILSRHPIRCAASCTRSSNRPASTRRCTCAARTSTCCTASASASSSCSSIACARRCRTDARW